MFNETKNIIFIRRKYRNHRTRAPLKIQLMPAECLKVASS